MMKGLAFYGNLVNLDLDRKRNKIKKRFCEFQIQIRMMQIIENYFVAKKSALFRHENIFWSSRVIIFFSNSKT